MKYNYKWVPIVEMDDEQTGEHTCYSSETGHELQPFAWITHFKDGWHVETKFKSEENFSTLKICKSLKSAKRWASMYFIAE